MIANQSCGVPSTKPMPSYRPLLMRKYYINGYGFKVLVIMYSELALFPRFRCQDHNPKVRKKIDKDFVIVETYCYFLPIQKMSVAFGTLVIH